MKRDNILAMLFCLLSVSCTRFADELTGSEAVMDGYRVYLRFASEMSADITSRGLTIKEESTVRDVNIYAVSADGNKVIHKYCELSKEITPVFLIIPSGEWRVRVIANYGRDLGTQTPSSLSQLRTPVTDHWDLWDNKCLPMSGAKKVTINSDISEISIPLIRLTAKITLRVNVIPELSTKLRLNTIQIRNVPAWLSLTGDNSWDERIDYASVYAPGTSFSYSYYMCENMAGADYSITSPLERIIGNAPSRATYLKIYAYRDDGSKVYYTVFPGENQTYDFNIRRNRNYIMNLTLCGTDPSDVRVSVHDLTISDTQIECQRGDTAYLDVSMYAENNRDNWFSLSYYFVSGNPVVNVEGTPSTPGVFAAGLSDQNINKLYRVGITQKEAGTAVVTFEARDKMASQIRRTVTVKFI